MIPEYLTLLGNHLWQSTLFAGVIGLLSLALRRNRASVRHWLWLAASIKFLVPFVLLVSIGTYVQVRSAPQIAQPSMVVIIETFEGISQPFAVAEPSAPLEANFILETSFHLSGVLFAVWLCGFAAVVLNWLR